MKYNYLKTLFLFLIPSHSFADGGISGALGFIDSMILVILIIAVIIHALVVRVKHRKGDFKQVSTVITSLSFSALTMMFWLIQFLNNIANRLYYSWPNYHGGVLLPVILLILMAIIAWTLKVSLQQHLQSNEHKEH